MTAEGESLENQPPPVDRIVAVAREVWARAKELAKILAQKSRTGVELLRLKSRVRSIRSEMNAHCLLLAQLIVRLDRDLGKESPFHPFSQIKSEIEAISRRQAKLERLAVEISDVRRELKRRRE